MSLASPSESNLRPLPLRPTLMIGVGNWGARVIQRVEKTLQSALGGTSLSCVGLLTIDERASSQDSGHRHRLDFQAALQALAQLDEVEYSHIRSWWSPGWSALFEAGLEPSLVRPLARLAFFIGLPTLRAVLHNRLRGLRDPLLASALLESDVLRRHSRIPELRFDLPSRVHVFADSGEGLSGTLIDLGFLLRDCAGEAGLQQSLWLAVSRESAQLANSYATLKELNHYQLDQHGFSAEWEPGRNVRPLHPVYDDCFLQSPEQLETVAEHSLSELLSPAYSDTLRGLRGSHHPSSLGESHRHSHRLRQRLARSFSSLASVRCSLRHQTLQRAGSLKLAASVARRLIDKEPGATAPEFYPEETEVRRDWLDRLTAQPLSELVSWRRNTTRSLLRGQHYQLQRVVNQGQRWVENELIPPLAALRSEMLETEAVRLRQLLIERAHSKGQLSSLVEWANELSQRLARWSDYHRRQSAVCSDLQIELSAQSTRTSADLLRIRGRRNWDGRRDLLVDHYTQRLLDLYVGDRDNPGLMSARLLQDVHLQLQILFRELAQLLDVRGAIGSELALLLQRAENIVAELDEQAQRAIPELDDAFDLAPAQRFWTEIYPRYLDPDWPAKTSAQWLSHYPGGLVECLGQETSPQLLVRLCAPPFARLPWDFPLIAERSAIKNWLPEQLRVLEKWLPRPDTVLLATPTTEIGHNALEKVQLERCRQEVVHQLEAQLQLPFSHESVADSEALLLTLEMTGHPVHRLFDLTPLREAYLDPFSRGEPLHIDANSERWADLKLPTADDLRRLDQAAEILELGQLVGCLSSQGGELVWVSPDAVHPLGEPSRALLKLTRADRLRHSLGSEVQRRLNTLLESEEVGPLLGLTRRLAELKSALWRENEDENASLTLLREVEQRIQTTATFRQYPEQFLQALPQ